MRNKKTEMQKLATKLKRKHIPFEQREIKINGEKSIQIMSPSVMNCKVDAVCHSFSYGGKSGLIEVMYGKAQEVEGALTAKQAVRLFKKYVK